MLPNRSIFEAPQSENSFLIFGTGKPQLEVMPEIEDVSSKSEPIRRSLTARPCDKNREVDSICDYGTPRKKANTLLARGVLCRPVLYLKPEAT